MDQRELRQNENLPKVPRVILSPTILRVLFFFLLCLFAQTTVFAETLLNRRLITEGDKNFEMVEVINDFNEYEVQIYLREIRHFAPDSKKLILIGRAIDVPIELVESLPEAERVLPKIITAWFIIKPAQVLKPIEFIQIQSDPWKTAWEVIQTNIVTENDWYAWVFFEKVATTVSIACSNSKEFFDQIVKEQLTLWDLELRLRHLRQQNPGDPLLIAGYQFLAESWKDMGSRIDKNVTQDFWVNAGTDVAITVVGAKLVSLAYRGGKTAVVSASRSELAKKLGQRFSSFRSSITSKVQSVASKVRASPAVVATASHYSLARLTLQEKTSMIVKYLEGRSRLTRMSVQGLSALGNIGRMGIKHSKYVALVTGIQISAEALARPEDLYDPNPIIMIDKMSSDKELIQNVAYMSNETFWMAGVATYLSGGLAKKMAGCAVVAVVNSVAMNFLVKGEVAPERVLFDTSWEALIGNGQTQFDLTAMKFFEGLAAKSVSPKLRFAGYALVVVTNQAAGYYTYAKITHAIERDDEGELQIAPDLPSDMRLALVPIMTDDSTYNKIQNNLKGPL